MTDEAMTSGRYGKEIYNRTYALKTGDLELIDWGREYLGCSRSDFVRSAIRAFAMHLQAIDRSRPPA